MTDETLCALRERWRTVKMSDLDYRAAVLHDVPLLLDEIDRLRGLLAAREREIAALKASRSEAMGDADAPCGSS
jgi:hypothetical protein